MLDLITGRPGSGKSYEATAFHILPALKAGRHVITNMPLSLESFAKINPDFVARIHLLHPTSENLRPFSRIEDYTRYQELHSAEGLGAFYCIDEAHMCIPAGNKNTEKDVREWYALHRHYAADVVIMTQSVRKLNKEICDMVRLHIQLAKNDVLGFHHRYRRFVRDGVGGELMSKGANVKYDKQFFGLYQTHTGKAGVETHSKEKTIWSGPFFRYVIPLTVVGLIALATQVNFGGEKKKPIVPPPIPQAVNLEKVVTPVAAPAPAIVPPVEIEDYPFKGATFMISARMAAGTKKSVFITALLPDGRSVRVGLDDLLSAGYSVVDTSECFISLNHKLKTGKWDINYADCNTPSSYQRQLASVDRVGASQPVGPEVGIKSLLPFGDNNAKSFDTPKPKPYSAAPYGEVLSGKEMEDKNNARSRALGGQQARALGGNTPSMFQSGQNSAGNSVGPAISANASGFPPYNPR
jgi:zona occludens toxin